MSAQRLDRATLEAAAHWFVELRCEAPDPATRLAHQQWLAGDPRHRQAWERLQRVQGTFAQVSAGVARPLLASAQAKRREVLKVLSLLLAAGGAGTLAWQTTPLPALIADQRTGTGERRSIGLQDGSQLHLNTATAVDIHYSGQLRELRLLSGEILIETAKDALARPFIVHTGEGSIRALGTRFIVRRDAGRTRVSVQEHAVQVRCSADLLTPVRVEAGQQLSFERASISPLQPANPEADAWLRDLLVVHDWRLDDFINELQRYRPGHLGCHPAVAGLRISGAFQLANSDPILANLSSTLPVRIRQFSRYWVRVEAA
ncbi:FecR domain-containing protein [Pseudomonas sp. NPDC087612]|uniref:FecR domain-containing protein n=1 Tax=unclassified Pseudomonas TaxID=196821 RepID=UPI0005EADB1E|nr:MULTISPECIES: FecR domain-containing protein [unclassified Pseudomonas]KJK16657.1 iron dicitrate transport regulator FecR [Pseudomonas sp. 2(2015)]QVM94502.1 FecR domain-containing protein [Pseudomonas sp. SORT22]UVL58640.1 FecR domain-containing protein [Pseudomonas sp. B21-035]SDQ74372.1 FecR family protein [Pseudomonas sp. UC 17F4]